MEPSKYFPTYVFATVNHGRAMKVVEELRRNSEIDLIAPVAGKYDLALRLKQNDPQEIYKAVKKIREIPDIRTTATHPAFEGVQPNKKIESHMPVGITLLQVERKPLKSAIEQISEIPGLVEAFTVPGDFDIVALWQGKTAEDIMKNSLEKLETLQGFSRTETLLGRAPLKP